jgi:hypothetical protein
MEEVTKTHDDFHNDEIDHIGDHEELHLEIMKEVIGISIVPNVCIMGKDQLVLSDRLELNDVSEYHE